MKKQVLVTKITKITKLPKLFVTLTNVDMTRFVGVRVTKNTHKYPIVVV